jgi:hypothetical protein
MLPILLRGKMQHVITTSMFRRIGFGLLTAVWAVLLCSLASAGEALPKPWQVAGFKAALNDPDPDVFKAAVQFPEAPSLISAMGEGAKD